MGKLQVILLGGDPSSPHVRRFLLRALVGTVIFLAAWWGVYSYFDGANKPVLPFALVIMFLAFVGYETWVFYQNMDEFLRQLSGRSLAITAFLIIGGGLVYALAVGFFGIAEPALRDVIIASLLTFLGVWSVVAARSL